MNANKIGTLWVVGGGNMGGALLARWCNARSAKTIILIDPAKVDVPAGCQRAACINEAEGVPDVVVVAVKPNIAAEVLAPLAVRLDDESIVISVMAGLSLAKIAEIIPAGRHVRAMPNTPAKIGKGVTGLCTLMLSDEESEQVGFLFEAAGTTHWLPDEGMFDALTAVSGSGPAYVFRMVEALAAAGESAGLDEELARQLARQTVIGAGALLDSDDRDADALRRAVTSPGGTTQAGLEALDEEPGLPALMRRVVRAAAARSREMGQEN